MVKSEDGFEKKLNRLQEIVDMLENENTTLEQSMKVFEEGVKISKDLSGQLDQVKQKIEVLKKDAQGNLKLKPFEEEK